MNDFRDLKAIAKACEQHQPLRFMRSHGALYIRNDNGIVFDVHQNRSFPDFMAQNKDYADLVLAANPATVLALIAENERQAAQFREWQASHHANYCKAAEERDQLKAEIAGLKTGYQAYERVNAELKAEIARLRAGMTADYDLDAWLDWAREAEALRNSSSCVDDLSALVRQLIHRLRKAAPDNDLPEKALDYLKRKGLQGSPLRNEHDDAAEREAQKIYDSWAGHDGFVPWVPGGNSLKQDEARRLARAAMGKGEQS